MEADQYPEAERVLKAAVEVARKLKLPPRHDAAKRTITNLANLYHMTGRSAEAAELLKQGVGTGPVSDDDFQALIARGYSAMLAGPSHYAQAEDLYNRALAISEANSGKASQEISQVLYLFAMLRCFQTRFDDADAMIVRSLAITAKNPGVDTVTHAISENVLAMIYYQMGRFDKAEPLLTHSCKVLSDRLGPGHPSADGAIDNLAATLAAQGRFDDAIQAMDRARRSRIAYVNRVLPALPEHAQFRMLASTERISRDTALAVALARRADPGVAARSAEWMLNSKAVIVRALSRRTVLVRESGDAATRRLFDELRKTWDELARITLSREAPADFQGNAYRELVGRECELSSRLGLALHASGDGEWVELAAIRDKLPSDAVLVEFARIFSTGGPAGLGTPGAPISARYAAWVIPPAKVGDVALIDLGPAEAIDRALEKTLSAIQSERSTGADRRAGDELRELTALLYEPLRAHLGPAHRWALSPDGALWLVPWAALPIAEGRFAVEDHLIHLAVSGRDLLAGRPTVSAVAPAIFADPSYSLAKGRALAKARALGRADRSGSGPVPDLDLARPPGFFSRLVHSQAEARAIEPHLKAYAGTDPLMFQGDEASETEFKSLRRPRAVVLSTHAFFLDHPKPDWTPFFPDLVPDRRGAVANPLLNCGLAMAGYNEATSSAKEGDGDGLLSGLEVVGVDLRGTDLVVLSACETARGEIQAGEGVAGLRQAFQVAGAGTVVATSWKVPDAESAQLMAAMFDGLARDRGPAAALREAQLALIANRRKASQEPYPYLWAAFSVTGFPGTDWGLAPIDGVQLPDLPDVSGTPVTPTRSSISIITGRRVTKTVWPDAALVAVLMPFAVFAAQWWWRLDQAGPP
jgi:tetratricopeptide (TPR) repeat protein